MNADLSQLPNTFDIYNIDFHKIKLIRIKHSPFKNIIQVVLENKTLKLGIEHRHETDKYQEIVDWILKEKI